MLIMTQPLTKLIYYRNTPIFILQNLRFDLELKILQPSQKMEILGVWLDFVKMELLLPEKNLGKIILQCKKVPKKEVTILELFNLVGTAINCPGSLSAKSQVSCLQHLHIESLNISNLYQTKVELYQDSKVALFWWIEILSLFNVKSVKLQSVTKYLRITLVFA